MARRARAPYRGVLLAHTDDIELDPGVRQLLEAFSRKERTQKANESWQFILEKTAKKDDDEETESDITELPPLSHATPSNAPRRRGPASGRVVVQGSGGGNSRYQQQEVLPINLHLPRIAAMHQQDAAVHRSGHHVRRDEGEETIAQACLLSCLILDSLWEG